MFMSSHHHHLRHHRPPAAAVFVPLVAVMLPASVATVAVQVELVPYGPAKTINLS